MNKTNLEDLFDQLRELHAEEEELLAEIEAIVTEEDDSENYGDDED
jgi:hypothetical protein